MAPATTFGGVVELLRKAEGSLIAKAGQNDPADRVCTLRGIYYGTEWSLDFKVEHKRSETGARIRNLGFLAYTGGNIPADPRPAFAPALFDDLQRSQSIHDSGRGIDIGHLLIGLETRNSLAMRTVPLAGQGGTGIEIVTWLGDLGGGAANLARKRIKTPALGVGTVFNKATFDYGVMDNLEGDAGGYLVACGSAPGGAPVYPASKGVADAIADYLPLASSTQWSTRAARFATALGATVGRAGIINAKTVIDDLTDKLYDFAVWYAATRWIPSGELLGRAALAACTHMHGAAREVATVFVATLSSAVARPSMPIRAGGPYPRAILPSTCTSSLLSAASTDVSAVRKQLETWRHEWSRLFE